MADFDDHEPVLNLVHRFPVENALAWAPAPNGAFLRVRIASISGQAAMVVPADGPEKPHGAPAIRVRTSELLPLNPPELDGVPDNTQLMHLHDAGLLHNLRTRYRQKGGAGIYTYTAFILIVVNPFADTGLYTAGMMKKYIGRPIGVLPPHIFAVSDRAYRAMKATGQPQSIVVSGESGAGKTETCKHIMRFLTLTSQLSASVSKFEAHDRKEEEDDEEEEIEEVKVDASLLENQLLDTNPILEAFGNAKTLRNNNSSRFGKFTEINFNKSNRICGATIITYLLEKSRLVSQQEGERNFHIFYMLCRGATKSMREKLLIGQPEDYAYLRTCTQIDGRDDVEGFKQVQTALETCGITPTAQVEIWSLLSGLLHLGNVVFDKERRNDNARIIDDGKSESESGGESVSLSSSSVAKCAAMLGVEESALTTALLSRFMAVGTERIKKPHTLTQAQFARDALAKDIYKRLFDWLVVAINRRVVHTHIGVLDIFGFEVFDHNSFEQLMINHTNEKLQSHFNTQVLLQEQDIYEKEAIRYTEIEFEDNTQCIDLLEQPRTGMMAVLDDECIMPKATDRTLANKIHSTLSYNPHLTTPRLALDKKARKHREDEAFVVRHFAGEVLYEVDGFREKNSDDILPGLVSCVSNSKHSVLADLYEDEREKEREREEGGGGGGQRSKFKSVGGKFISQLGDLMATLSQTTSHFVRCIKPNSVQKARLFDDANVLQQLRCSGMLETLRLMQSGFPTRASFEREE